jgi:uncharacterized repeat protein (TIGR01451 family)
MYFIVGALVLFILALPMTVGLVTAATRSAGQSVANNPQADVCVVHQLYLPIIAQSQSRPGSGWTEVARSPIQTANGDWQAPGQWLRVNWQAFHYGAFSSPVCRSAKDPGCVYYPYEPTSGQNANWWKDGFDASGWRTPGLSSWNNLWTQYGWTPIPEIGEHVSLAESGWTSGVTDLQRRSFDIPPNCTVTEAEGQYFSDNTSSWYLNGALAGVSEASSSRTVPVPANLFRSGSNLLAVQVSNDNVAPDNPIGIQYILRVKLSCQAPPPPNLCKSQLSLTKSPSPTTYNVVGQTITYSYVIQNTGNVTLTGPFSVSDDKATVTCTQPADGALSPGETMTCSASYAITQADLNAGSVTNIATASGGGVTSNQATATVNAARTPGLLLTKSANPTTYNVVGQTITYSYVIQNTGNVTLTGPFSVSDDKATVTCTQPADGALSPGETMTCSASYAITQADLNAGSVTNIATASGGGVTSNQATATVNAARTPSLLLTKSANPVTYNAVGQTITYIYVIQNTGNTTLNGPFSVSDNKATVTCTQPVDGALSPGETMTCSASYAITQADFNAGSVTNIATASGGGVTSNQATATVRAVQTQNPSLSLTKSASPASYNAVGQVISYTLVATNDGNVTLTGVSISDPTVGALTCTPTQPATLTPGANLTCTGSYTVTQTDLDAGSIKNTAKATGTPPSGTPITSPPASVTVPGVQNPALTLDKTASLATYSSVGTVINYSYKLTNSGNVTLSGPFTVSDDKATVTCPATSSLAPGAFINCTASYSITQADLDSGAVTNSAKGKGSFKGNDVFSNQDSETVKAVQTPALSLSKNANPMTYSHVGQVITYTYTVTNRGNVTLSGPITISDDKLGAFQCSTVASLAPGASVVCTRNYVIQAGDLGNAAYLPEQQSANATYGPWLSGANSTMDITLSNVAPGSGVPGGVYTGWCIQANIVGGLYNQPATLYSSTGMNLPSDVSGLSWNEINYVLNHKIRGAGKTDLEFHQDVQTAIWLLLGETDLEWGISPEALQMVAEANAHPDFVPVTGQTVAVIVYSDGMSTADPNSIQETILEVTLKEITNHANATATHEGSAIVSNQAQATIRYLPPWTPLSFAKQTMKAPASTFRYKPQLPAGTR